MAQSRRLLLIIWLIIAAIASNTEGRSRKQKDIIRLLKQINNGDCFNKRHRYTPIKIGLGRDEIFTVFNGDHLADAKKLYKHFIDANTYEDFYDRAVWARRNVNGGLFVYAFSAAVLQSRHTQDIILPPIYEINPNYFISGSVIDEANRAEENHTVIDVDVSADDIRYFTEDVGLNSYYYYINLLMPFWKYDPIYPVRERNGEYYLHLHQQLLARYNLERYALGLNTTPSYDYEHPIKLGYNSDLVYSNGVQFPSRKDNSEIAFRDVLDFEMTNDTHVNAYTYLKDFEKNLRDFIQSNKGLNSYEKLTEIMGINSNSDHSGKLNYARIMLGNPTKTSIAPSALEHYETSLRDPMFWPMLKRTLYFYNQFSNQMVPYNSISACIYDPHQPWNCPPIPTDVNDIMISDVTIDNLETYFDNYTIDLANGVHRENCEHFDVHANIKRLNHKPFSYSITLSTRTPFVFVKVFIGPKYDEQGKYLSLRESRYRFFEIDRFSRQLLGNNVDREEIFDEYDDTIIRNEIKEFTIERSSITNNMFSFDRTGFNKFYKEVIDGFIEGEEYEISSFMKYYGFPKRLLLPKGSPNGKEFQLYVIAIPTDQSTEEKLIVNSKYDFNYPFNRPIDDDKDLRTPNTYLRDIKIYHND